MINERAYNYAMAVAKAAREELVAATNHLATIFQPYFDDEITVDYQPSDGLVIIVTFEGDWGNVTNITLGEAKEEIERNPKYYKRCKNK